jgi:hypothetical protein
LKNPRDIAIVEAGFTYEVPRYTVTNDGIQNDSLMVIEFCRGDKSDESKPRQTGVFVESLLEAVAHRLTYVNVGELSTRETSVAITKIQEAIMWLEKRSNDRKIRNVEGTYKK